MKKIVLTTFNAKYIHTSLALRYLKANLNEFENESEILEFTIKDDIIKSLDRILQNKPKIVAFSMYIWNMEITLKVATLIKKLNPKTVLVVGGPEVSYPPDLPDISVFDYVIAGYGEKSFYELCKMLFSNQNLNQNSKIIRAKPFNLKEIKLPYYLYTQEDIDHRLIYVETSRGCPYKCEFCTSSLESKVFKFSMQKVMKELDILWEKGVKNFKFLDRALQFTSSIELLDFFLKKNDENLFLHFEFIPYKISDELKNRLNLFPPKSVQLEVGIQSFDKQVCNLISRPYANEIILPNLKYLSEIPSVYIHSDLIAGLPSQTIDSFKQSFNLLFSINPDEIQLGILKLLRGTPIHRHIEEFQMKFNPFPPYEILETKHISFEEMLKLKRFARYWEITSNSGNFDNTLKFIISSDDSFEDFSTYSDFLYQKTGQTYAISLKRLSEFIYEFLINIKGFSEKTAKDVLISDYERLSRKSRPFFMQTHKKKYKNPTKSSLAKRQNRHKY